ncbi:flocculation protein FLO11-like isoform X3 [Daphnia pulex]|uniref:flocculation protein FLO11-like isoform X3 n=1 Tax=Daphnia pulex TaxID=6669 RepID=UPI001EDD1B74|nr:flocculation protein FLO11-like isoform X3 [Daphnia pulex]
MVLNLFKTLASKNEAAHHRTQNHHQSRGNQEMLHAPTAGYQRFVGTTGTSSSTSGGSGGASSSSARISRMARSLPQHVPEVLTRPDSSSSGVGSGSHSSRPASHSFGSGVGGLNPRLATGHHLLTGGGGSLSAPSSPSQLSKSSSIPLKMRQGVVSARHGAPPPNIIVEKGRIEFVKTATSPSAPPAPAADAPVPTLTTEKHKLQMGTKIFRPPTSSSSPSPKKSTLPESSPLVALADEMPPKGHHHHPKSKETTTPSGSGGSISFRDRSASPKFNSTRESTPPLPESSRIPSGMARKPNPTTTPDVVASGNGRNLLPRPGFINKSRETSPSPQQSSSSSCSSAKPSSIPSAPPSKSGSSNSGASGGGVSGAAVPVSPNLIRWRAKLSGSSGPCVTNHLNLNVSAAAAAAATTTTTNNSSIAGSHPKKTLGGIGAALVVKLSGNGAKSCPSSSSSASSSSKPTPSTSAAPAAAPTTAVAQVDEGSTTPADAQPTGSTATASDNQMQLLNLHYEVKRLEETVHTLLPLRHQQSALIQSYEERLSEAQTRLAAAEAEVAQLKERLARCEGAEVDGRQVIQQLEADKSSMAASHEQQRLVFDKCLDEIANHVVQALISQKNLQGECRRLRSQVSDLEQRNVALNLLLTQSLRDSMLENNKKPTAAATATPAADGMMVKSNSYDLPPTSSSSNNQRDSLCSTVSDSEIRMSSSSSIFETGSGVRPLVSKDSNWTLSSTSSSASSTASQAALAVQQSSEQSNPVERAEKLLAVLKHRLFSAQLNSYKSIRMQPKSNSSEIRRSLVMPGQQPAEAALPARPSTLSFCPSAPVSNKETGVVTSANDPSTPSVRALVQVLEKRVGNPLPSSSSSSLEKPDKSPRPPLPLAPGLVRSIRNAAATSGDSSNDSPASKDEGYSTMSSDVQVDSSSSSSSSFIASGCSSPATLRRSASGSTPSSTTRSLPIAKRKTLLNSSSSSSSSCSAYSSSLSSSSSDSRPSQPNRSISLQETHSGAVGLEELKEEASDETNEDAGGGSGGGRCPADSSVAPSSSQFSDYGASSFKREWPGVQLGTLCEDWSPSSVASDSEDVESDRDGLFSRATNQEEQGLPKWKSDDELYKADQEEDVVAGEESWKTLDLRNKSQQSEHDSQHPLRRSRAQVQLSTDPASSGANSSVPPLPRGERGRVPPNYSEHEMEDWILDDREHEPSPSESEETNGATALPAISENSYESDGDDEEEEEEEEELFVPEIYSPACDLAEQEAAESEAEEDEEEDDDDAEEESLDTEFTRDYYRLVKFESNRSLANSEKYDHCPPGTETASSDSSAAGLLLPPPDRQVALQTVLDFIAEQQRYCAIRETADAVTPELPHPNGLDKDHPSIASSTLHQLRHLIADDDSSREEDSSDDEGAIGRDGAVLHSGFSTNWMPVHGSRVELVDLNNAEVRASMLEKLFRSSSSSSLNESSSSDSFEGNEGRGNVESSEDSCPPPIASPSATEESQC